MNWKKLIYFIVTIPSTLFGIFMFQMFLRGLLTTYKGDVSMIVYPFLFILLLPIISLGIYYKIRNDESLLDRFYIKFSIINLLVMLPAFAFLGIQ